MLLVPLDLEATFDQRLLRSVEQDTQQPDLKIAAVVPLVPFLFINEKETRTRGKKNPERVWALLKRKRFLWRPHTFLSGFLLLLSLPCLLRRAR